MLSPIAFYSAVLHSIFWVILPWSELIWGHGTFRLCSANHAVAVYGSDGRERLVALLHHAGADGEFLSHSFHRAAEPHPLSQHVGQLGFANGLMTMTNENQEWNVSTTSAYSEHCKMVRFALLQFCTSAALMMMMMSLSSLSSLKLVRMQVYLLLRLCHFQHFDGHIRGASCGSINARSRAADLAGKKAGVRIGLGQPLWQLSIVEIHPPVKYETMWHYCWEYPEGRRWKRTPNMGEQAQYSRQTSSHWPRQDDANFRFKHRLVKKHRNNSPCGTWTQPDRELEIEPARITVPD